MALPSTETLMAFGVNAPLASILGGATTLPILNDLTGLDMKPGLAGALAGKASTAIPDADTLIGLGMVPELANIFKDDGK